MIYSTQLGSVFLTSNANIRRDMVSMNLNALLCCAMAWCFRMPMLLYCVSLEFAHFFALAFRSFVRWFLTFVVAVARQLRRRICKSRQPPR